MFVDHLNHLNILFEVLNKAEFKLSIAKSLLFQKRVHFLGFILDSRGISADPQHIEKIVDFPCPRSRQELQGFLGVCGYYRRFSIKHANYIEPFRHLLQTGKSWTWTEVHTRAFQALKNNFTHTVIFIIIWLIRNFIYKQMPVT